MANGLPKFGGNNVFNLAAPLEWLMNLDFTADTYNKQVQAQKRRLESEARYRQDAAARDAFQKQLADFLPPDNLPPGPDSNIPAPPLPPDLLGGGEGEDIPNTPLVDPRRQPAPPTGREQRPKDAFERVMDLLQNDPLVTFGLALAGSKENSLGGAFADAQNKLNAWRKSRAEEAKINADTEDKKADTRKTNAETKVLETGKKVISVVPAADGYYAIYADGSTAKVTNSVKPSGGADVVKWNKLKQDAIKNATAAKDPLTGEPLPAAKRAQLLQESLDQIEAARLAEQNAGPVPPTSAAPVPTGGKAIGTIEDGYRFKGGNPADAANWELVQ